MPTCLRCGRCCHYVLNGVVNQCKFLITASRTKTICRVYSTRLGQQIDKGVFCVERGCSPFDFPNCSYNVGKPTFPDNLK